MHPLRQRSKTLCSYFPAEESQKLTVIYVVISGAVSISFLIRAYILKGSPLVTWLYAFGTWEIAEIYFGSKSTLKLVRLGVRESLNSGIILVWTFSMSAMITLLPLPTLALLLTNSSLQPLPIPIV